MAVCDPQGRPQAQADCFTGLSRGEGAVDVDAA